MKYSCPDSEVREAQEKIDCVFSVDGIVWKRNGGIKKYVNNQKTEGEIRTSAFASCLNSSLTGEKARAIWRVLLYFSLIRRCGLATDGLCEL